MTLLLRLIKMLLHRPYLKNKNKWKVVYFEGQFRCISDMFLVTLQNKIAARCTTVFFTSVGMTSFSKELRPGDIPSPV